MGTLFLSLFTPFYHIRFSRCNTMQITANKHLPFLHHLRTCSLIWCLNPCFQTVSCQKSVRNSLPMSAILCKHSPNAWNFHILSITSLLETKPSIIMKKNADKGKLEGGNNTPKPRRTSSKNSEIEAYLSSYYEFRYNTVLGRTEHRRMNSSDFTKVGRYEINTLRREIDNDIGIITSSENLYSIIESSFSPRINPI